MVLFIGLIIVKNNKSHLNAEIVSGEMGVIELINSDVKVDIYIESNIAKLKSLG